MAEQKILCHVRALFDYHPYDDQLMPCPEAGLAFQFGDVLAILNQASTILLCVEVGPRLRECWAGKDRQLV